MIVANAEAAWAHSIWKVEAHDEVATIQPREIDVDRPARLVAAESVGRRLRSARYRHGHPLLSIVRKESVGLHS